jgi:PPM family protein phosphatase
MHITWGQATDKAYKQTNQDAVFSLYVCGDGAVTLPEIGIFIVADGMGESSAGAKAAKIAVQTIAESLLNTLFKSTDVVHPQLKMEEAIVSAFHAANMSIMKEFNHSSSPWAGAVVTAAIVTGDDMYIGHIGDTVAVLVTADDCKQLTRIHRMRTKPYLTVHIELPEHRDESKMVNVLYRALGQSDLLDIDTVALKPTPNSWLLLLSDGLLPYSDPKPYSYSTEVQISDKVKNIIMKADNPQQACDQLIALANERGGEDNASVIVIKVSE